MKAFLIHLNEGNSIRIDKISFFKIVKNCLFILYKYLSSKIINTPLCIPFIVVKIVLTHYPGHEVDAGRIGVCIVFAGMLGSVACGIVLDKTHRFK